MVKIIVSMATYSVKRINTFGSLASPSNKKPAVVITEASAKMFIIDFFILKLISYILNGTNTIFIVK